MMDPKGPKGQGLSTGVFPSQPASARVEHENLTAQGMHGFF